VRMLLVPAAGLYSLAVRLRAAAYSWGWLRVRELNHPVVCVGNLTVGGSGKTPLVAALTQLLASRGFKPGILTRGYGRQFGSRLIALAPGVQRDPDPREVGDEPALLARALPGVPMVICADRFRGGRFAEEHLGVNVHVLDDGFQHLGLRHDVDIVALDVTQPIFEDAMLPAGRLREPVSGLRRAHLMVLTRVGDEDTQRLEQRLHVVNSKLQIFRSRTELKGFVKIADSRILPVEALPPGPVFVFCGIGNPRAFFEDLRRWGLNVISARSFPDHHRYTENELANLDRSAIQSGAAALVTTEKDLMNLPENWQPEVPLFTCRIEAHFTGPTEFEESLLRLLAGCGRTR